MVVKSLQYIIALLLISNICFGQILTSEKSSIHITNSKKKSLLDKISPDIKIISPNLNDELSFTTSKAEVNIIGQAFDESGIKNVFINDLPVEVANGNLFASSIKLEQGINKISVVAIDKYGNFSERQISINYLQEFDYSTPDGKGKYYALLIGIDNYQDSEISDLDNPVNDAQALSEVLIGQYAFNEENVTLLKNVTREDIISALDEFSNKITLDDNFLLFFAGHGWWDEKAEIGYWLPSDAKSNNKAAWVRNSTISDYLKAIDSKHTLLIADACFGGSIFKARSAFSNSDKAIHVLYELKSRKAMTSGTLTVVPDRSVFVKYLIQGLNQNTKRYITSEQLFSSFKLSVINNSNVVPQYGEIKNVGDEGGDFIFLRRPQK